MKPAAPAATLAVALLACVIGFSAQAQQQTAGAPAPSAPAAILPTDKASVEGYVMAAADGQPLKRARVRLLPMGNPGGGGGRPPQPIGAVTDAQGKFALRDLPPGQYRLMVERNGFVRQSYGQRNFTDSGSPLTLTAGQRVRDVTFRMTAAGVVTGRIFDDEGEPVPNVQVRAMRHSYTRGLRQMMPVGGGNTNDLGEYRLYGLAPGRYYLAAFPSGGLGFGMPLAPGRDEDDGREQAYVPIYYPGSANPESAALVTVGPGEELTRYDISLIPQQAVRVRGRITNVPAPAAGARQRTVQVGIIPRNLALRFLRGFESDMVQDPQGNFELRGVTPGQYVVTATYNDGNSMYSAREFVDVSGADVDGMTLTLVPAAEISGKLKVEGAALDLKTTRMRVTLRPMEDFGGGGNATVAEDGSFTLRNLPPGNYTIAAAGNAEGYYLKSARAGAADVLERGVTLTAGRNPVGLDLTLSPTAARIDGLALNDDGLPVGGVTVVLVPHARLRNQPAFFRSTVADQNGRFALRNLPPGEYKLFAWEEVEQDAWFDAEFLAKYEDRAVKVEAKESGVHTIDAKVLKPR